MSDTIWTDERVADLTKLWQNGMSAQQIASLIGMGVTRNAVIGKVHRLGLKRQVENDPDATPIEQPVSENSVDAVPTEMQQNAVPVVDEQPVLATTEDAVDTQTDEAADDDTDNDVEDIAIPVSKRVTLWDLKDTSCRWPIGDPAKPDFTFCGGRRVAGKPYCNEHINVAFVAAPPRMRRAA